ncbi:MAG: FkbM family methyltransferase, partial [Hyphomicrobiaceae bacterium]
MTVTPNRFPVDEPLTTLERWRYRAACAYVTSWQYRDFAKDDRTFLEVLMANGVEIATVFDVGASNGAWGLMVPHFIPGIRSFMFEPLVGHSEGYSRFMRGLLSSHPDWTLFTCALSDKEGETTIYMDKNVYGSTLIPGPYAEANWQKIDVEVRTIDGLVASGDATQPDVIKIDTQGSELAILKGGERVLAGTKALLLET